MIKLLILISEFPKRDPVFTALKAHPGSGLLNSKIGISKENKQSIVKLANTLKPKRVTFVATGYNITCVK